MHNDEKLPRHCEVCHGLMGDMTYAAYAAALRVCDDCHAETETETP